MCIGFTYEQRPYALVRAQHGYEESVWKRASTQEYYTAQRIPKLQVEQRVYVMLKRTQEGKEKKKMEKEEVESYYASKTTPLF